VAERVRRVPAVRGARSGPRRPWWTRPATAGRGALGVEAYTSKWTGVRGWRLPIALTAATLGWVPLNGARPGLIPVGGLLAFVAVVWIARASSVVERRRVRWTRGRIAAVAAGVLALAYVSLSYGVLHPLSGSRTNAKPGAVVFLHNDGRLPVRVLGVSAPGHKVRRVETDGPPGTIPRGGSAYITLADGNCRLDRVTVRLHVAGRDVRQSVRLESQGAPRCV
jgi:hypothetical protein